MGNDKCFVSTRTRIEKLGVKTGSDVLLLGIEKDMGFVKGHKYEVRATRLVGGKEKVYAKTSITLK